MGILRILIIPVGIVDDGLVGGVIELNVPDVIVVYVAAAHRDGDIASHGKAATGLDEDLVV